MPPRGGQERSPSRLSAEGIFTLEPPEPAEFLDDRDVAMRRVPERGCGDCDILKPTGIRKAGHAPASGAARRRLILHHFDPYRCLCPLSDMQHDDKGKRTDLEHIYE